MLPIGDGRSGLPPFFVEAAKNLKPGDLSPVFRSEFGWHLIKLEARSSGGTGPASASDPRVREFIRAAKAERALDDILQPILQDPERVRIYLQLPRSIAAQLRSNDAAQ
jgi:parvulin-like peptidyl-prolyl isomerase